MKDIIITSQKIRRERNIYIVCFIVSFIINIVAVCIYTRPWVELLSQIGYVFVISIFIYLVIWIPRILFRGIMRLFHKRN